MTGHIGAHLFTRTNLVDGSTLDVLHRIFADSVSVAGGLAVTDLDQRGVRPMSPEVGSLRREVEARIAQEEPRVRALARRLDREVRASHTAIVELRSGDNSVGIIVEIDDTPVRRIGNAWYLGNSVTVEVVDRSRIGEVPAPSWLRGVVARILKSLSPMDYGFASSTEEYRHKNMLKDARGVRAIGRDVAGGLPGVYWLNVFGKPCVQWFGLDRLRSLPAGDVEVIGDSVVVRAFEDPRSWNTVEARRAVASIRDWLGDDVFYVRGRQTRGLTGPFADDVAGAMTESRAN